MRLSQAEAHRGDAEAELHAAGCPLCATRLACERRIAKGLRALAVANGSLEAPARVEARLLAEFRLAHGSAQRARAWWKTPAFGWAAAGFAAIALAFGVWIAPKRSVAPPAAHHKAPAQIQLAAYNPQESDDGFIPLPDAPQIDPNDDVNVVRMELPRSAMLEVGLDVPPDQVAGTIVAEVKLGSDGLARAVRFME
jgi:hypothetical protein